MDSPICPECGTDVREEPHGLGCTVFIRDVIADLELLYSDQPFLSDDPFFPGHRTNPNVATSRVNRRRV